MKPLCVYNVISPNDNSFLASFIHVDTNKQMICYVLDGDSSNTDILLRSIKQCSLIGFNNKIYDDILLNYIAYQKDVNTKEIHALSNVLIELHNNNQPPWRNEDVAFYVNRDVDSIDLSYVSTLSPRTRILKGTREEIIANAWDRVEDMLNGLNAYKKEQHYGFRKNYNKTLTSDELLYNYMNNRIGLTNNEL